MVLYIIMALMALVIGGLAAVLIMFLISNSGNKKQGKQTAAQTLKSSCKLEFSKIVLTFVLLTYFVGVFIGVKVSLIDFSQLGVLLAYIGTPTAAAIGFYCWKAKAENIVKIKKDNPEETEGVPVDLNNINNTSI
ncbi:MAG: hypothetical protein HDR72_01900 [Ruminococcaceae bacterium]|nr:hypothetical protein [Oscillospiraceae bacterium]